MTCGASPAPHRLMEMAGNRWLALGLAVALLALFVIGRLPLYAGYWIPWYVPDSGRYFETAYAIAQGHLPRFSVRTPGYPLVLAAAITVTHRVSSIIVLQQLATLLSGLWLYAAFVRARAWLAVPAAIAVAGFFATGDLVLYESYIGPESLYTSCLVGSVAALVWGLRTRTALPFITASLLMAFAILLRPAGLFLIVIVAVVVLAMWASAYPRTSVLAMAVPLPAVILALCAYNALTIHQFTISPFGSVNLMGATATFWTDSVRYPAPVRDAIQEVQRAISEQDRETFATSWDPAKLYEAYNRYYNLALHVALARRTSLGTGDPDTNRLFKAVAFDAIRRHPKAYAKFVYTSLCNFLYDAPLALYSFASFLDERYDQIYGTPPTAPINESGALR